ncbi:hypothetical protein C7271_23385 [filamentous cyanobacterium CCP5]|nr:hypothetical protein C7271_23385 [filamentous cyanobacterium CCP5]
MASTYETNSLSWQIRQAAQRLNEGVEYWFAQLDIDPPAMPNWVWPAALGQGLFWVLVTGLAFWLSWQLYGGISRYWQGRSPAVTAPAKPDDPSGYSSRHWWHQAQAAAAAGRYDEACWALYQGALQRLEETQTLPQDPSRTDGEYLAGLEQVNALRQRLSRTALRPMQPYELLIRTHERIAFGDVPATAETFQRCRRAYQDIQK